MEEEEKKNPRLFEVPFDSRRKRKSTNPFCRRGASRHPIGFMAAIPAFAFTKGAPKETIELCTKMLVNGQEKAMDDKRAPQPRMQMIAWPEMDCVCWHLPRRIISGEYSEYTEETVEQDLILLGLIAMKDPPRRKSRRRGKMSSRWHPHRHDHGDYGLTAETIADALDCED